MSKEPLRDIVPDIGPEETASFWAETIDYGFYTHGADVPWEDIEAQAEAHGKDISRENLGWGTQEFRFMVLPETPPSRSYCPICKRDDPRLFMSDHHLRTRRADTELTERLCRECHKFAHSLFSNKELADPELGLDSVEGLLAHEEYASAVAFIKKLRPGRKVAIHRSNRKKKRGRSG